LTIVYLLTLNERYGIKGLAVTFLVAWALQAMIQIPFLKRKDFIYTPSLDIRDPGLKNVSKMALPIIFGSWVQPVSIFMLGAFASFLGDQSVAAVKYANRVYLILAGIFVFAMMNYLFPMMSRQAAEKPTEEFKHTFRRAFESLCFFIIPLSVGAFLLSPHLISLVYERGAFSQEAAKLTAEAFSGFSLAIFGFSLFEITSKAYYAMKKVAAPTLASTIAIAVTFALSYLAVFKLGMGLWSVSLAFSIGITVSSIIMLWMFNRKTDGALKRESVCEMAKSLGSSALMGGAVFAFKVLMLDRMDTGYAGRLIATAFAGIAGFCIYMCLMALFKSSTFGYYYKWALEKIKGGRTLG
jgi:putative peptidoglycan lipid II flippase